MPLDGLSEGSRMGLPSERQLSLLAVLDDKNEKVQLKTEQLLTPAAVAANYVMVSAAADALTRNVLTTAPADRRGLTHWWEKNSNGTHRLLFADQRELLRPHLDELARAKAVNATTQSELSRAVSAVKPFAERLDAHVSALSSAEPVALFAEANSLKMVADASADDAVSEIIRAMSHNHNGALHGGYVRGAGVPSCLGTLELYHVVVKSGLYDSSMADAYRADLRREAEAMKEFVHEPSSRANELAFQQHRNGILQKLTTDPEHPVNRGLSSKIGDAASVARGEKLFLDTSPIGRDLVTVSEKLAAAKVAATHLEEAKKTLVSTMESSVTARVSVPESVATAGGHLAKALGVMAASTTAGYAFDHAAGRVFGVSVGDDNRSNGGARLAVDGCLVPAVLLSDIPLKYRLPLVGTAFGAGRANTFVTADNSISPRLAAILQPNQADTILTATAVMTPLSMRIKALAIAGSLAAGRVVNMF